MKKNNPDKAARRLEVERLRSRNKRYAEKKKLKVSATDVSLDEEPPFCFEAGNEGGLFTVDRDGSVDCGTAVRELTVGGPHEISGESDGYRFDPSTIEWG